MAEGAASRMAIAGSYTIFTTCLDVTFLRSWIKFGASLYLASGAYFLSSI